VLRVILARAALFIVFASAIWALLPPIAQNALHLGSGGYGSVAEEKRHTEYFEQDQSRLPGLAFDRQALDERHQDDRPDRERDHAVHPSRVWPDAADLDDGAHRVLGASADVAEDDAERTQGQGGRACPSRGPPAITPSRGRALCLSLECRGRSERPDPQSDSDLLQDQADDTVIGLQRDLPEPGGDPGLNPLAAAGADRGSRARRAGDRLT
jgi:Transmembrane secretion effector